mmetsp:Transcript_14175/g.24253  ORF Transcript_14175/g.24253 Transcript_14175/m.24253 type:complete len:94 (+) Transcript_14175:163-444(+)|eukprot:CAMPEP_0184694692 /NCGR_PEP_ID=MMETSP0313-20130426/2563_1 /TAXON_ID=2792 /ORGANISM="Porphyridium aerugineum, Strain SAG 1380-2" /LENGTH=93 /DNA_ID=CAMNT_0027153021 /DNA_START=107 /DNA_END=388 /DNA_ORIENTATION=-
MERTVEDQLLERCSTLGRMSSSTLEFEAASHQAFVPSENGDLVEIPSSVSRTGRSRQRDTNRCRRPSRRVDHAPVRIYPERQNKASSVECYSE